MQQWFGLSDPAVEEALHDVPMYRDIPELDNWRKRLPNESTIFRFQHLESGGQGRSRRVNRRTN